MYLKKSILFLLFFFICPLFCMAASDYETRRQEMIVEQIEERGVSDTRVLEAMDAVPRHDFVPKMWRFLAYADRPLPIEAGQTISQPYIVALMTELLKLKGKERVLEVGTGSGYQAAILAEIVPEVYSIEIIPELAQSAEKRLKEMGYTNIHVKCGDGYYGWPDKAPFDAIIVTCGAPNIPPALFNQLADGGRLVIPVGEGSQKLMLIRRDGEKMVARFVTDVIFVPLLGDHN